ncbi:hypothetical protein HDK90DRAFT_500722 [Phyllosticta capitalensis]|uniref:Calmodulin n=1 Tax=Phyllosticta capitalensis TaxID=121624 RepID=A0ABR1Z2H0_9PEZI
MSADLSQQQVDDFRAAFAVFDKNSDACTAGVITAEELGEVMRSLGQEPTEEELRDIVNELDVDTSGSIDFEEFLKMMAAKAKSMDSEQELRQAFAVFDRDGTGTIDAGELSHVLKSLGEKLSEAEIEEIIRQADVDGDGMIDYNEFVRFIKSQ